MMESVATINKCHAFLLGRPVRQSRKYYAWKRFYRKGTNVIQESALRAEIRVDKKETRDDDSEREN
jgi:hypothetical protein